ncbi:MAG: dihydropteroate synthase [Bacteroidales bacterium]|nr:dihydropteroate synthase [Bacteroidales bacterium]
MGILNLSPDSFQKSGMGDLSILESELADIVDIGAVSTRPGADDVSEEQEWARLEPAMEKLREGRPFSLDTTRSSIVRRVFSLKGGFTVNDVSAGELDREMLPTVAELGLGYVAMHRRGNPRTMDLLCDYPDGVMAELLEFFRDFSLRAERAGLRDWILDPGLGFAKTPAQNMEILRNLDSLRVFGRPILVGPSHKRFTRGREGEVLSLCRRADIVRLHPDWIETFLQTSE